MAYTIKDGCISCDSCRPECPQGAIQPEAEWNGYWIDPTRCDECKDLEAPRCLTACDIGSLKPLQPKKGRAKSSLLPPAILDIFLNGKTSPFASSMVMWETCNILAQGQTLPWSADNRHQLSYLRSVRRGKGEMRFRLAANPESDSLKPVDVGQGKLKLASFDIRATCIHLIFAAYVVATDVPWQNSFVINNQHIEQYLGLDKRKDLTKLEKLTLIKKLVHQTCQILVEISWPRQGKVPAFELPETAVWQLLDTQYYFEEDSQGGRHLIGLAFTIQTGHWSKHFLNKHDFRGQTAFYQYSTLPQSLILEVMSNWQQHEGAVKLLLWLVFKLRLGGEQRMTVRTLLRIAYGDDKLTEAVTVRGAHKRLLKTFEGDLETLYYYGLKPIFDADDTYPLDIQPLWARVSDIPDSAEDALEFWAEDAHSSLSLTDTAPKDKWQRLLNARLLGFDLPEEWQQYKSSKSAKRRHRQSQPQPKALPAQQLSNAEIKLARQRQRLSQRALADRLGKSQSWIRDVEKGRFNVSLEDQALLRKTLNL